MSQSPRASTVIELLAELVRINSVNPAYEGGPGEGVIADWLLNRLRSLGIETESHEVFPGRPNVLAKIPGRDRSRCIVFEAHTDTVSVKGMTIPPFDPVITNGNLYGRGSCDTKGGLAAMLHAVETIARSNEPPPLDLWFCAAVDEEYSFRGVVSLCERLRQPSCPKAVAALVAEPTGMRPVIASKGVLRWKIHTHGRAAHSSKPHLGVNAISMMARVIQAIEADARELAQHPHPLLGPATANVGVIHGGIQVNFVPDQCSIEVDRRLLPGERAETVLEHYQNLLHGIAHVIPEFRFSMDAPMLVDVPLETDATAHAVTAASNVLHLAGRDGTPCGVPFGSDASKLAAIGIPSLIIGPGDIDLAHTAAEHVPIAEVEFAASFFHDYVRGFA
jgi:acetylornithine deacetylase